MSEHNLSFGISDLSNIKKNKSLVGYWEKELLGKPHEAKPHYIHSKNIAGNIGFLDKKRGIVYTVFLKDRNYTNSFLVNGYKYPNLHKQLGEWFLNHYWESRHLLNKGLIGGMGSTWYEEKQSDIQSVARSCGNFFYTSLDTRFEHLGSRYSDSHNNYYAQMLLYKYGEEAARKFGVKPSLYSKKRKKQGEPRYPGNKSTQEYMKKIFEEQLVPEIERVQEVHTGPIHRVFSEPKKRTTTAILHTFGTVLSTAGPKGLCKISKDFEKSCPDTSKCLLDAAKCLYMFRKPDQYFSLSLEKPIPGFQGTVLTQVPTEQQFLLGCLYLQATGGKGIKGIGIPPYSDKRVKDFQQGGLQKVFSKKKIDLTNHLKNRSVALTLITGKSLESLWEQTGLNRPLNEPWIPCSPRIKNTPYQNDKDLLFGPTAKNVEETVERLFGFVEDVSPGTAGTLKYLIEFGGSRIEEIKSLGRKILRTGGVPREYAQDTMDAFEDVVTLGLGGKAFQTVSKLKINTGAKKVAKAKANKVNKAPYDPQKMKELLENKYGKLNGSTVPEPWHPNVKLAGQKLKETGVVFDKKGYPIFDKHMKFETRLPKEVFSLKNPEVHMKEATKNLRSQIQSGKVDSKIFTRKQLQQIKEGKPRIDGHTWHHHQELGRMQLVDKKTHNITRHVGGMKTWFLD